MKNFDRYICKTIGFWEMNYCLTWNTNTVFHAISSQLRSMNLLFICPSSVVDAYGHRSPPLYNLCIHLVWLLVSVKMKIKHTSTHSDIKQNMHSCKFMNKIVIIEVTIILK